MHDANEQPARAFSEPQIPKSIQSMSHPTDDAPPSFVTRIQGSSQLVIDRDQLMNARCLRDIDVVSVADRERIVGPADAFAFEQLRAAHGIGGSKSPPLASNCDYFLWGEGEAPHRTMTKLGGLPALPAGTAWPTREGRAAEFFAQLNFADSKEFVPALPDDLLLVFRHEDDAELTSWDDELYDFVWVDPRTTQDFVRTEDLRHSKLSTNDANWAVLHGYRLRNFDEVSDSAPSLASGVATKIGGLACDMQSVHPPEVPADYRFLAQIAAVWPAIDVPYPVVTRAAPVAAFPDPDYESLMSGPGDGVLCLYLDRDDAVRIHFSCS